MNRLRAFVNVLVALALLLGAAGWLIYSHRAVSVACQRAGGKVDCSDTERIADQSYWPQPVWNVTVRDVDLTARSVDDEGNPGAVVLRTQNDTQSQQFTSGMLGTNESRVEAELHQFLVVRTSERTLQLDLPPGTTWRDWGVQAGLTAVLALGFLYALFRLFTPARPRVKAARRV